MNRLVAIINQSSVSGQSNQSPGKSGAFGIKYLLILVQLVVLSYLVNRYAVESHLGLPTLFPVVLAGFIIHSLLPLKYRL
ncbi:MAG: hypothetical protein KDC34_20600, partial [Saprospiraceae bacterium]|nr:hypothetical protein [Saprospiraceae bacterium]